MADTEEKKIEKAEKAEKKTRGRAAKTAAKVEKAVAKVEKAAAKPRKAKAEVCVEFQGEQFSVEALTEAAQADFAAANPKTKLSELKLYIKPEERTAYYVANGDIEGRVAF